MNADSVHIRATHDTTCVLYSRDTGKIMFTHRFAILGNAPYLSPKELEKEARAALENHRKQLDLTHVTDEKLEALVVPSESFYPGHTFSVDRKNGTLIAHPRPRPAAS